MKTSTKVPGRRMPPGLTFAAGMLVGATAVFVPLTSAGHPESIVEGSERRAPGAVGPSAHATRPHGVDAGLGSLINEDSRTPDEEINVGGCDVQLD